MRRWKLECTSHSSFRADFLAPQQAIVQNTAVCKDAAAHTCTSYFPRLHALLTFFSPRAHTTRSAALLSRDGGGRPPTSLHSQSSKRRLEQDAPRTHPVAPASDVYCPDSSGQTPLTRVHFSPLCTKNTNFVFPSPAQRLFNSDNGSLLPSRLLRRSASPQTPPPDQPRPLHAPMHGPAALQVPLGATDGTHCENTK